MTQTIEMKDVLDLLQLHLTVRAEMIAAMFVLDPVGTTRLIEKQKDQDWAAADQLVASMTDSQFKVWLGDDEREGLASQFAAA